MGNQSPQDTFKKGTRFIWIHIAATFVQQQRTVSMLVFCFSTKSVSNEKNAVLLNMGHNETEVLSV